MNEKELLDWVFYNVEGDLGKEGQILKIALCQSYQQKYTDLYTMCKNAGLAQGQAEEVKLWKQHNKQIDSYILITLYDYLVYYERERYLKAVYIYYKQNS